MLPIFCHKQPLTGNIKTGQTAPSPQHCITATTCSIKSLFLPLCSPFLHWLGTVISDWFLPCILLNGRTKWKHNKAKLGSQGEEENEVGWKGGARGKLKSPRETECMLHVRGVEAD